MERGPGDLQDDRGLAERVAAGGDEEAFRELYRRHAPALYGLLLRLTGGSEADAADLLQETWIRAASRLGSFRWESALGTWLGGIAVNCSRERARREARAPTESLDEPAAPAPAAPAADRGERLDWERAIRGLPDGYRQVLVLCDIEGYTHQEVGRMLGISTGTSKSQLSRARRALRALVRTEGGTT